MKQQVRALIFEHNDLILTTSWYSEDDPTFIKEITGFSDEQTEPLVIHWERREEVSASSSAPFLLNGAAPPGAGLKPGLCKAPGAASPRL